MRTLTLVTLAAILCTAQSASAAPKAKPELSPAQALWQTCTLKWTLSRLEAKIAGDEGRVTAAQRRDHMLSCLGLATASQEAGEVSSRKRK